MKITALYRPFAALLLCYLLLTASASAAPISFGSGVNQFNMDFVPIGSPGNVADTTGSPNPAGAVGYTYQMGTYEVSRDMITKANAAGGLGISLNDMSSFGGNGGNRPATGVTWNEAARFVNWLNTSQGFAPAYKFTTGGVNDNIALWTPADTLDYDASNQFRSKRANYVLPNLNEWYKAAYYDPNHGGPSVGGYWNFPTGSDTAPTTTTGSMTTGQAVYGQQNTQSPADVTNAGGLSPFGVMGLGGNVWEWEETEFDLVNDSVSSDHGIRGGDWGDSPSDLSSSIRYGAKFGGSLDGFRVVSLSPVAVPEPSTWALIGTLTIGLLGWAVKAKRKPSGQASPSLG